MASRAERGECSALRDGVVGASKRRGRSKRSAEQMHTAELHHYALRL